MKPTFSFFFKKYLIALILIHGIIIMVNMYYAFAYPGLPEPPVFIAMQFLFNIILAIMIRADLKKLEIKSPLCIVATLIFNLLGIMFFLLKVLDKEQRGTS